MPQIEINNVLDGKRLCNTLANILVEKFEEITPGCKTEITVFNHRSFFIVNGYTTAKSTINISEIFKSYFTKINEKLDEPVKVIDIIKFVESIRVNPLSIIFNYDKFLNKLKSELTSLVDDLFIQGFKVNLKVDTLSKIILYQTNENDTYVTNKLSSEYPDYKLVSYNFDDFNYNSDRKYGISYGNEKLYYYLGDYISNHLFYKSISSKLDFYLHSDEKYNDITSENVLLKINNDNHIVKTEWLESLILDVFPFDVETLNKTFTKEFLDVDSKKLNLLNELILF
jgi:hypothetical protein